MSNLGVEEKNQELLIEFNDLSEFSDAQNRLVQYMLQAIGSISREEL